MSKESCDCVLKGNATPEDLAEFLKQVREFFDAVVEKKGPPFHKHLRRDQYTLAILPGDKMITKFDDYIKLHEWWMANTTGRWSYRLERAILYSSTQATITIVASYSDIAKSGQVASRNIRIKDNFVKLDSIWYMTESQNTVLSTDINLPD